MDNARTYQVPSLLKTAYYACNQIDRDRFDSLDVPDVDLRSCCESLFEILKIPKSQNEDSDRRTMILRSHFSFTDKIYKTCEEAESHGHINCLKLAREIGLPWDEWSRVPSDKPCDRTARLGYLECLKYARENGCFWDEETCRYAAENGHMDCLVYARENGCPWDEKTCSSAAENGHMDCLVYARENGCPWDERTCSNAAENGHLDCLVYARKNGCPWDEQTCSSAAENGHMDCLVYARENGCPWDELTCYKAASGGHFDCSQANWRKHHSPNCSGAPKNHLREIALFYIYEQSFFCCNYTKNLFLYNNNT
ncbi:unnamed protein product [Macrosiphum euphorbiae]|uniref:Uncharacterized protein n=1 Tax=Macrosiphum euphorbiae TaxID=13131 RepID=A0AAV0VQ37_9HEMI|nr:unnamed protein product [Macrosiphum euphorbiae]